eukprot:CAMPEP_0168336372 /NCGR_PEP_ID=MMETSP0213-20121227/11502_1 /TAXON_ID=151035 /ORGANISM="Euplotes harpa, Strain FSP1.4" /LENGTH=169 /DNA_ID=CAMNT_0008341551 /DNA_START=115 /DNA_END=622 /DNA_ORIENTATION=+
MTTVGYGDAFPKTMFGRLIGICVCLWGVLLVSLFVVSISDALEFNVPQKNAFNLIHRIIFRDQLKDQAAGAIISRYRIKLSERKHKSIVGQKENIEKILEKAEIISNKRMIKFKAKEVGIRNFDNATETTYVNKNVDNLMEMVETVGKEKNQIIRKHENMLDMLRLMIK